MRCPECGFHSFDYLDHCKKCGIDLTACKQRLRLPGPLPVVPPVVDRHAAPLQADISPPVEPDEPEEEEEIDFGFDILQEPAAASPAPYSGGYEHRTLPDSDRPTAVLTPTDDLDFDNPFTDNRDLPAGQSFPGINELDLNQPFPEECEQLPDDDLPKLDDRF